MKGSKQFTDTIKAHLDAAAATNELFAAKYANESKSIDKCIEYILGEVSASGQSGFDDDEIFGMAIHYYEEAEVTIKSGNRVSSVVTNHHVELSEEEKAEAKQRAIDEVIAAEKQRMQGGKTKGNISTPAKPNPTTPTTPLTLFDL